jgi:hypothetical protein
MDSTKQNVGKIVITALFAALACALVYADEE